MTTAPRRRDRIRTTIVLVVAFAALVLPGILLTGNLKREAESGPKYLVNEAGDQEKFHLPVIREFAAQPWAEIDLVNYKSATAPGYHLFMAAIVKTFGENVTLLQLVNAGLSLLLLLNVARGAARLISPTFAAFAAAPLLCSSYFLGSSIWLTTDNAALLFVSLVLSSAALAPANPVRSLRQGVFAAMAVATRQLHVWLAAPIFIAAAHRSGFFEKWVPKVPVAEHPPRAGGWPALIAGAIGAAMPFALLGYFVWIWGGLIPPTYRGMHGGDVESIAGSANFALPALALSLLGALGVFYLPVARQQIRSLRVTDPWVFCCVVVGLMTALLPQTSFDPESGRRFGWMWEIIKRAPAPMERSVVPVVLAPLGALVVLLLWRKAKAAGRARQASILVFCLACWMAAQTANAQAWQRYCEPLILIFLAWMACLASPPWRRRATDVMDDPTLIGAGEPAPTWEHRDRFWPRVERAGPAMLAGMQLLLSIYTLYWPIFSRRG